MRKHEIYKQYDNVFNNRKMKHIKTQFEYINNKADDIDKIYKTRLNKFSKYCGVFIDKDVSVKDKEIKITKENGIQTYLSWNNKWESISGNYDIDKDIEKCVSFLSDEGKQIYENINKLNPTIKFKRKMIRVGTIQPYHKEYYNLPSYSSGRDDYPINLVLKEYYGGVSISIPAFHRYPIISKWAYQSDAQSLKRQMLIMEFYEDIKKHLMPIIRKQKRQMKWIEKNDNKIIRKLSKYEMLLHI